MRISDWSSDGCSSDLRSTSCPAKSPTTRAAAIDPQRWMKGVRRIAFDRLSTPKSTTLPGVSPALAETAAAREGGTGSSSTGAKARAEERRGGKEGVSTGSTRGAPEHEKKKKKK